MSGIKRVLDCVGSNYALLVGGGLGYESKKYLLDPHAHGDIDLCVVFENDSYLKDINDCKEFADGLDFEQRSASKLDGVDIQQLLTNGIAVLRLSGKIKNIKTSINFMSFSTLENAYDKVQEITLYKQAHTKTYSVMNAKSTGGTESIAVMYSPENWSLYVNNTLRYSDFEHRLIIDKTWFITRKSIYAGLMTDFIAKGQIYKDTHGRLLSLQNTILRIYVANAQPIIKNTAGWHRMFAGYDLFSNRFKATLDSRLSAMQKVNNPEAIARKNKNINPISGFANPELYKINPPNYIKRHNTLLQQSALSESVTLSSILKQQNIGYEQYMLTINAECKRLTRIICSGQFMKKAELPCVDSGEENLYFVPIADDIWYSTGMYDEQCVSTFLERQILSIFEGNWQQAKLAQTLIKMRIDVLLFIASQNPDVRSSMLAFFARNPGLLNIMKARCGH